MNRNYRQKGRYLAEVVLAAVAIYLFFIAYAYSQETREALILGFLCIGVVICLEIWARLKGRLRAALSACMLIGIMTFISCELCIAIGAKESIPKDLERIDYILVLGNKLESSEISSTLKGRLDKAVELSGQLDVPIIVSGGNSEGNDLSEACVMGRYLISRGVQNDILLEEKALDTRQNFLYAAELAGTESELIIITSELHLFRAKMLARDIGFRHVYGACAKTDGKMYLYYNLREVVSILRETVISIVTGQNG